MSRARSKIRHMSPKVVSIGQKSLNLTLWNGTSQASMEVNPSIAMPRHQAMNSRMNQ